MQSAQNNSVHIAAPMLNAADHVFTSFDGARLGLSVWTPPKEQKIWAVLVALHGMDDYGEAFAEAGPWFAARGVATYAYDARGFGRSPDRGIWAGEDLMTRDLGAALDAARTAHPDAIIAVLGDSMGAASAMAAFGGETPPEADRVVLAAPAVWGWSSMPPLYSAVLWSGAHLAPFQRVTPPRSLDIWPSDNIPMLRRISRDPLMITQTRIDAIYGLVNLMQSASERAAHIQAPTMFLYGAQDQIIPREAALRAVRQLPPEARTALYPDGYHMLLRDLHAELVYQDVLTFLLDPGAPFPSGVEPLRPESERGGRSASFQAVR